MTTCRGRTPVLVLSHSYWTRHFGGDAGVLNQAILVNNAGNDDCRSSASGIQRHPGGTDAGLFLRP